MIHLLKSYKKYWFGLLIIFSIIAYSQNKKPKNEVKFQANENTQWITDNRDLPISDSLFYLNNPSPLFRKEFKTEFKIENAKLFITAAGYYKASINGKSVGKNVLEPAWTDFSKRIYFTEYDVTDLINNGENCIGLTLGNGFYNPLPLRKWGRRNLRNDTQVGKPVFIAKLHIQYQNGESVEINSDNSWKFNYGPIIKNSVYLGTAYDARKKIKHWDKPGFDDSKWETAKKGQNPGGKLQKAISPPVQITEEMSPAEIYAPEEGIYVVDMGVNFTGTYKIKLKGNFGDTVTFRFGERVYKDGTLNPMTTVIGQIKRKGKGGPGAPDVAWQTDSYVIGKNNNQWFTPEFTYHTYRYMEITGLNYKPKLSDVKGLFIHSNISQENSFSSSNELLNSIQEATDRTFRANLVSVQSDCPSREKFGYGGDLNATSESFIYNYDMQSFYRKTVYDWIDAMNDTTFVDTAPYVGVKYCGISWESAFLTTQYYLYLYYNDTELIKELYEQDKKWMDKVARIHPNGLVDKGLSDHESMEPVPVELTGTSHYLQCARIMKTFASVMEDHESEKKYEALARKLQGLVKAKFWDKPVKEKINRQTLFSTLLYHDIVPENEINAAKDSLLNAVKNGPSGHFNTGIFGTKYVLESLSKYASPKEVFDIVNSTVYPGWGHMIDHGATTIWETWKESDDAYSNCHPMFGTVTEWYYRWLAGIQPDPEHPGFKEFILAPSNPKGLDFVNCTYNSPYGAIKSNWKKEKDAIHYEMTIPKGSTAKITLPNMQLQQITIRRNNKKVNPQEIEGLKSGKFKLDEGAYLITVLKPGKHLFILSGQSNMKLLTPKESFIPAIEAEFGIDNVIFVKDAEGSKPIRRWYRDWKPLEGSELKAQPDMYDSLMTKVYTAIENEKIETVTFIWMQGERDAKEMQGEVYEESLTGLYRQISNDIGRKDVNFVIGRLSDFDMSNKTYRHWTMIRDIQVKVGESNSRFDWVNTDDLNDGINKKGKEIKNDLHMSAEGYITMGKRFAETSIQLIENNK